MGGTTYSVSNRETRATVNNYRTANLNDIFTQNRERKAHESMKSQGITVRECRDSEVHPCAIPIIIALDLTGSMGHIPHELIKDGLPKLVSRIIQNGVPSPAILFLGVGDHEVDREPLQVGQFESGDAELDMWLTRTYIESGGGGNGGESYGLAHYFAARHCVTDHWEKRGQKGFLFTIGDEPNLTNYPNHALREIMDNGDIDTFTDIQILEEAKEKWEVYHLFPNRETRNSRQYWDQLLGENSVWLDNVNKIPIFIADTVLSKTINSDSSPTTGQSEAVNDDEGSSASSQNHML